MQRHKHCVIFPEPSLTSAAGEGPVMKSITVYRIDYVKKTRVPIGTVVERRKKDRGDNLLGLLRVARKTYSSSVQDSIQIAIDVIRTK